MQEQEIGLTKFSNQNRPRPSDFGFTGKYPLDVFHFLTRIIRLTDQSNKSEAILIWIVDDFLNTPAKEAFRAVAFDSWTAAVLWLLLTYLPESTLEAALRLIQVAGQRPSEYVHAFGNHL